jgi:ABC-2 type transport system permease protein
MNKIFNIAWKDLILALRDPGYLVVILLTPFALTLAMTAAFGRGNGGSGLASVPVVIVNQDTGEMGGLLVELMESPELADLLLPTRLDDVAAARAQVDADQVAAAVIIPPDLSATILAAGQGLTPASDSSATRQSIVEVYGNPTRPVSSGVIQSIVEGFLNRAATQVAIGEITVQQLLKHGLLTPAQLSQMGAALSGPEQQPTGPRPITLKREMAGNSNESQGFDWLGYMAPSMAILFLMFSVTAGGRTLLTERSQGTLPRMLTTPTPAAQVIGGKVLGVYLVGLAQMGILISASALLFNIRWGSAVVVMAVVLSVVAAATSWGILIAAYARSVAQANSVGTAVSLVFAIGAGNFFPRQGLPVWLRKLSFISPNAWGIEAFTALTEGGGMAEVVPFIAGLLVMTAVLFTLAIIAFRRQYR